jgi:hypothetical protein
MPDVSCKWKQCVAEVQVIEDFENGLQYAEAEKILGVREAADCGREYHVRWSDGAPDSWENEDNVSSALVLAFEKDQKEGRAAGADAADVEAQSAKEPAAAGV